MGIKVLSPDIFAYYPFDRGLFADCAEARTNNGTTTTLSSFFANCSFDASFLPTLHREMHAHDTCITVCETTIVAKHVSEKKSGSISLVLVSLCEAEAQFQRAPPTRDKKNDFDNGYV